ncbi:hypothetical protein [Nitrosovibrio sp. Nv6]|uniref:hypothetical protein n=1 Tax=Nitrosovibrio sp. Nv6 TaxID=1855340 RepID=UPI0008ACDA81|nr:hypothetical protein [Nitrosovibrio sp. Nv6]SEO77879.1 hypothetical protein SAMN05216316_1071 [Nitrosovibrio sp. Nv6]
MANALNRTTREFLRSVHEPAYPAIDWIINPDLSAVVGYASKYWVITGDAVSLMDQAARDAVDAAELVARRDSEASQLTNLEGVLRAFMLIVLDEFNAHANKTNSMLDAMDASTSLADMKTRIGQIADYPLRTEEQLRNSIRNRLGS